MGRRARRAAHLARDAVAVALSVPILASQWGRWGEEPAFLVTSGIAGVLILLSAVDVVLVLARVKGRGFFFGNAVTQLVLGFLLAGLFLPFGLPILVLNVVALVTLRQKKTAEELLAHPPPPRGRNYMVLVGVGVLAMAGSLLLPWLSADSGSPMSLIQVYSGILGHTGLPGLSVSPVGALFALLTLVLSPVAILLGAFGFRWRRMSGAAGVLGILAGGGLTVALPEAAGVGPFIFLAGAVVVLTGFIGFRRG